VLKGRIVVLGVTGSIAAFKALEIVRELKRLDADVIVCMTRSATKLISPLSFESLSGNEVIVDLFIPGRPLAHIGLTERLDLLAVIPATANVIGKFAAGIADDALSTIFLATKAPVLLAPAMNERMWENPSVRSNVEILTSRGCRIIEPSVGELASRSVGKGRLADKEEIMAEIKRVLASDADYRGKNMLVTASRTEEPLDPIRYISNRSSGKLGYAIAARAQARNAEVTLVSGPSALSPPYGVNFRHVRTSDEMCEEVLSHIDGQDYLIMTAAIADYRPDSAGADKIKDRKLQLKLVRTVDILKEVKKRKSRALKVIGFSLEVKQGLARAKKKMEEKGLDMVVMCNDSVPDADEASVQVLTKKGALKKLPRLTKDQIAEELLNLIAKL
jgi:phosphopantothenoylcysteine decarboxylase/phosphopantothenate--cysteine ligase